MKFHASVTRYHPERDVLLDEVFGESFKRSARRPFQSRQAVADALGEKTFAMINYIDGFRKWTKGTGSNYFDISPISGLFAKTDVDDVHADDIDAPYDCFYLHFGKQEALAIPGTDQFIEGAYVGSSPGSVDVDAGLAIIFVCNFPDWGNAADLDFEEIAETHALCARAALHRGRTVAENLAYTEGLDGDEIIFGNSALVASAMRMLVNSLLYISSPKAEVEVEYGDDAPEGWVKKAANGDKNAIKVLEHRNCTKVRVCGRQLRKSIDETASGDRTVEPHWRKGHWRRVVFGEGRTERRWHWFLPTVVNSRLGMPGEDARIYDISDVPEIWTNSTDDQNDDHEVEDYEDDPSAFKM